MSAPAAPVRPGIDFSQLFVNLNHARKLSERLSVGGGPGSINIGIAQYELEDSFA